MMEDKFQAQIPTLDPSTSQPQLLPIKIENRKSKIQNLSLVLLLLLYLATAFAYSALAPLTTGPDELAHYEYVRFIAEHGRLPFNGEERSQASYKSDQPPLYHLLAALPAALVDPTGPPFLKRVGDHPRRQLIERTRHAWGLYNTEDERWPYRAEILRWQVGRWVAILFGAATVAVTFFIARDLFASLPPYGGRAGEGVWLLALSAAAIVAFIPRFGLTGSMLNYETTLAFLMSLFLWVLLRMAAKRSEWPRSVANDKHPTSHISHLTSQLTLHASLLGLLAGLAILTKLSALILPLEIIIGLWLIGRYQGWPRSVWLRLTLLTLAITFIVVSLWFGFVMYHFNTIAADGLWTGLLRPLLAADASDATTNQLLSLLTGGQAGFTGAIENLESGPPWEWASIFFRTFWLVGIEAVQPLASVAPGIALALCLLAAYGLIQLVTGDRGPKTKDEGRRTEDQNTPYSLLASTGHFVPTPYYRLILSLLALHLTIPLLLPLLRYAVTYSLADTAQGRHVLFPAAPAFAILLVWGLSSITHHAPRTRAEGPLEPKAPYGWAHHVLRFTPFLPALLLLIWTGAHLWTMTWAYNPPLPVSTLAEAKAQAAHQLNQPLNNFITLVGYTSQIEPDRRVLRLDLFWQATAISPVDYLTEVSLLDAQEQAQAQWLGYSAGGRYPSRAWDAGDIVRDTVWLPLAGLAPGSYHLSLALIPTSRSYPPEAEVTPLTLTDLTLPNTALRTFNGSLAFTDQAVAAAGYSVWQNGQALTAPQEFRYRETVLVTFSPLLPNQQRAVEMIDPANAQHFAPVRQLNDTALFIVGPDWPSGDYHLQVSLTSPTETGQQVNSGTVLRVVDRWQRQFTLPALPPSEEGIKGGYVQVEANFADQVKLLGYDLGANRAEPGGGIPLTLYWQGLDWMGQDYTIFTKLLAADQTVHGGRDRLPREGYRTLYWAPGEIVSDPFGVPVAADAPPGVYYLNLGLYRQVGQQAVSLPLVQNGQPLEASSVNIGPIKIGGPPPGLTHTTAKPQNPLNQPFGDTPNLTLLGYDLTQSPIPKGHNVSNLQSPISLTLYWRSETPLPLDYTTFVHLRNAAGETVAQKDQPPLNGAYPTSLWDPGEIIADEITVSWPAKLPAGKYQLVVGLYDFQSGQRLTVPGNPANEISLTNVEIR
jgi:hypothetical protein